MKAGSSSSLAKKQAGTKRTVSLQKKKQQQKKKQRLSKVVVVKTPPAPLKKKLSPPSFGLIQSFLKVVFAKKVLYAVDPQPQQSNWQKKERKESQGDNIMEWCEYLLSCLMYKKKSGKSKKRKKGKASTVDDEVEGQSPYDLINELTSLRCRKTCGHVFQADEIAFSCRTCQKDTTCVTCQECFSKSQHKGHDVYFHRTSAGGCCDCGDPEAWNPAGFCSDHPGSPPPSHNGTNSEPAYQQEILNRLPKEVQLCAPFVIEMVVQYLFEMMWMLEQSFELSDAMNFYAEELKASVELKDYTTFLDTLQSPVDSLACLSSFSSTSTSTPSVSSSSVTYNILLMNDDFNSFKTCIAAIMIATNVSEEVAQRVANQVNSRGAVLLTRLPLVECVRITHALKKAGLHVCVAPHGHFENQLYSQMEPLLLFLGSMSKASDGLSLLIAESLSKNRCAGANGDGYGISLDIREGDVFMSKEDHQEWIHSGYSQMKLGEFVNLLDVELNEYIMAKIRISLFGQKDCKQSNKRKQKTGKQRKASGDEKDKKRHSKSLQEQEIASTTKFEKEQLDKVEIDDGGQTIEDWISVFLRKKGHSHRLGELNCKLNHLSSEVQSCDCRHILQTVMLGREKEKKCRDNKGKGKQHEKRNSKLKTDTAKHEESKHEQENEEYLEITRAFDYSGNVLVNQFIHEISMLPEIVVREDASGNDSKKPSGKKKKSSGLNRSSKKTISSDVIKQACQGMLTQLQDLRSRNSSMVFGNGNRCSSSDNNSSLLCLLVRNDYHLLEMKSNLIQSLLLELLPIKTFKSEMFDAFIAAYPLVTRATIHGLNSRLFDFAVQLFTVPSLVQKCNDELIRILLVSFVEVMAASFNDSPNDSNLIQQSYKHAVDNLEFVLSVNNFPKQLLFKPNNLKLWMEGLTKLQGVDAQLRRGFKDHHVEYESEVWFSTFNLGIRLHSIFPIILRATCNSTSLSFEPILTCIYEALSLSATNSKKEKAKESENTIAKSSVNPTFKVEPFSFKTQSPFHYFFNGATTVVNFSEEKKGVSYSVLSQPSSLHLPLHRFFAAVLTDLLLLKNVKDIMEKLQNLVHQKDKETVIYLVEMPLRCLVMAAQIQSNLWRKNGEQNMLAQLFNYSSLPYCIHYRDADIFLLQLGVLLLDPEHVLAMILDRFQLCDYFTINLKAPLKAVPGYCCLSREKIDEDQLLLLVEECLRLIVIVATRLPFATALEYERYTLRQQVIHQLCVSPMTFSELNENLTLPSGSQEGVKDVEAILADVAEYRVMKGSLESGKYELAEEFLAANYDPYFLHLNKEAHEHARDRWCKIRASQKKKKIGIPYVPLPILKSPLSFLAPVRKLLRTRTVMSMVYSIFSKLLIGEQLKKFKTEQGETCQMYGKTSDAVISTSLHVLVYNLNFITDENCHEKEEFDSFWSFLLEKHSLSFSENGNLEQWSLLDLLGEIEKGCGLEDYLDNEQKETLDWILEKIKEQKNQPEITKWFLDFAESKEKALAAAEHKKREEDKLKQQQEEKKQQKNSLADRKRLARERAMAAMAKHQASFLAMVDETEKKSESVPEKTHKEECILCHEACNASEMGIVGFVQQSSVNTYGFRPDPISALAKEKGKIRLDVNHLLREMKSYRAYCNEENFHLGRFMNSNNHQHRRHTAGRGNGARVNQLVDSIRGLFTGAVGPSHRNTQAVAPVGGFMDFSSNFNRNSTRHDEEFRVFMHNPYGDWLNPDSRQTEDETEEDIMNFVRDCGEEEINDGDSMNSGESSSEESSEEPPPTRTGIQTRSRAASAFATEEDRRNRRRGRRRRIEEQISRHGRQADHLYVEEDGDRSLGDMLRNGFLDFTNSRTPSFGHHQQRIPPHNLRHHLNQSPQSLHRRRHSNYNRTRREQKVEKLKEDDNEKEIHHHGNTILNMVPCSLHLRTCHHAVHMDCLNRYIQSVHEKIHLHDETDSLEAIDTEASMSQFLCPLCKTLCNILIPLCPSVAQETKRNSFNGWKETLGQQMTVEDWFRSCSDYHAQDNGGEKPDTLTLWKDYFEEALWEPEGGLEKGVPFLWASCAYSITCLFTHEKEYNSTEWLKEVTSLGSIVQFTRWSFHLLSEINSEFKTILETAKRCSPLFCESNRDSRKFDKMLEGVDPYLRGVVFGLLVADNFTAFVVSSVLAKDLDFVKEMIDVYCVAELIQRIKEFFFIMDPIKKGSLVSNLDQNTLEFSSTTSSTPKHNSPAKKRKKAIPTLNINNTTVNANGLRIVVEWQKKMEKSGKSDTELYGLMKILEFVLRSCPDLKLKTLSLKNMQDRLDGIYRIISFFKQRAIFFHQCLTNTHLVNHPVVEYPKVLELSQNIKSKEMEQLWKWSMSRLKCRSELYVSDELQEEEGFSEGFIANFFYLRDPPSFLSAVHTKPWAYNSETSGLIALPSAYDALYGRFVGVKCKRCKRIPSEPAICLICGELLCSGSNCCSSYMMGMESGSIGECTRHAIQCGGGVGIVLQLYQCRVILIGGTMTAYFPSPYVDAHGEEDMGILRGKPLSLDQNRYQILIKMWQQNQIHSEVSRLRNQSPEENHHRIAPDLSFI